MRVGHIIRTESGRLFSIGFDPIANVAAPDSVFWMDADNNTWISDRNNSAGDIRFNFPVAPAEFISVKGEDVIIYRPGLCVELSFIGAPFVYQSTILRPQV
jgi:hypothetical protein